MIEINFVFVLPFIILLALIASGPILFKKDWEKYYPAISFSMALLVVLFYFFIFKNYGKIFHTLYEYLSFIILISSLFVISGGIFISIKGKSTPKNNLIFLSIGALLANFIGTTGASILLIRPFIKVNKSRIKPFHIIFFIFIVSNVSGLLTPIGDPPLFLGYLKGIPFFWFTKNLFFPWLFTNLLILIVFYLIDLKEFKNHTKKFQNEIIKEGEEASFKGLHNVGFLLIIILCVFIKEPIFLREIIFLLVAATSYYFTNKKIFLKNEFTFIPIKEVAILFFGIFFTMMPAIDWITSNAETLNIKTTTSFYWINGFLSSILDNAPTFLNSFALIMSLQNLNINNVNDVSQFITQHSDFLKVISFSSVAFGALTYIGNGPNILVKSIAEENKINMPTFFEYIFKYSILVLLPIYFVTWLLFF